jgi:choline-glycine betaine transporter
MCEEGNGHQQGPSPTEEGRYIKLFGLQIYLLLGGGLKSLQAASLATSLRFSIVLLGMCVCVCIGLSNETRQS